ncbi:uncharacterized protein EI97DRAFT_2588 [Westerdykella ornata]|uniref:Uncharacterized protein n=1 Tax=Westerdykella ornata TaxID=318751 RepID=A0A6A6JX13_WESOR|nr:uncharacterized protein EI97DRAFT_2588 [Westerdykella ornata]KAF2280613.1 hypothetical protein EI97DRAFT_2588 [Westerdykella ornata]
MDSTDQDMTDVPAAYYESLDTTNIAPQPTPNMLNLSGVDDFGPEDPVAYVEEHSQAIVPIRTQWINDSSVNLVYDNEAAAAEALSLLTHPELAEDAIMMEPQESRRAAPYSKMPEVSLWIRIANTNDRKPRRPHDKRPEKRRRRPSPTILDYGDEDDHKPQSRDRVRNRRSPRPHHHIVDSYRPDPEGQRESRYGRLRGRSASPLSSEDGRYGFAEMPSEPVRANRHYNDYGRLRDRSASPASDEDGRFGFSEEGRSSRYHYRKSRSRERRPPSPMSYHRRSDATDETRNNAKGSLLERITHDESSKGKGSLLSRMTKNGKPLVPRSAGDGGFSIRGIASGTSEFRIRGAAGSD